MDKQALQHKLNQELAIWQTKIDEAKVQINLAEKEIQSKFEPHLKMLNNELFTVQKKLEELITSAEISELELENVALTSFNKIKLLYEKAKLHLPKK